MDNIKKNAMPRTATQRADPLADLVEEVEEVSSAFSDRLLAKTVMNSLASRVVERHNMTATGVWVLNDSEEELELAAMAGRPSFPAGLMKASMTGTWLGKALQQSQPQVLSDQDGVRDELVEWARMQNFSFLAAYPLLRDSKVFGALVVGSLRPPSESQQALVRVDARLLSMVLREAELAASTAHTLDKFHRMVDASKALGSTLDLTELLGRVLDVAKMQADCERGSLFMVDEKSQEIWSLIAHGLEKQEIRLPLGKGIAGHVAQTGEIVNIPDAYADSRFNPEVDKRTGYRTRNILCLPIQNKAGKIIAALQLLNKKVGSFTDEDSEFLLTLSGHMALALENAQLHQVLVEKERMEKELALARGIQHSLLPETPPVVEGFEVALLNEPCYAVGGDYYDFLTLGQRTLLVVIADVEGKGVASALVMSNLQAALRALVLHLHSLNEIAEALNRMMFMDTRAEKYLSLFMGLIDLRRKAIHYINCGHVPPVIVRKGGETIPLTDGGMVIGLFENAAYERGQTKLQTGDVLILCTDGITESMDAQHEEYGMDRLVATIREACEKKAAEIVQAVGADVARFSHAGTHIDDKVMIVIKAQ